MKIETASVLHAPPLSPARARWTPVLIALAVSIAALLAIYWRTAASLVAIWSRSETFAHGYLIVPMVLWLVWLKRRELARLAPAPDVRGLGLVAGAAAAWLIGAAGDAQVVQQLAMTAMIPAAVLTIAGRRVALALAFPLAFLFFAVPVGEALMVPLMEWTATFTVTALQLTGIPVFREGLFFVIPSGHWSIVEGCSGLRYLIASVVVGTLFAYLTYQKLSKRLLFVLAAIVVPIIANGFRAYGIVMIAHLSDMRLALGIDHFIYGWVWFGIVIAALFWVGSIWRDPLPAQTDEASVPPAQRPSRAPLAGIAAAIVAVAACGPLYAAWLERGAAEQGAVALAAPADTAGWVHVDAPLTDWRPRYQGAAASRFEVYRKGDRQVGLYLGFYRQQRRGAELVTSTNVMVVQKHPVWANLHERRLSEAAHGVRETELRSARQRLLVWDWYWIGGTALTSPYVAKAYLARDRLLGRGDDAAAVILAAPYDEQPERARQTLREFASEMRPAIDAALAQAQKATP
ncbi:MAG TPA: exosortase A [Burkholderiales bacterium]|nr:exosortase A [Burkholderiales bacterium]